MKKFLLIFCTILLLNNNAFAQDYKAIYESCSPADFKLTQGIDPFQEKDYYDYAWAPYPLFRLSSTLYFKEGTISPGYYLLVPRVMKDRNYIFFKENGKVKYTVPVYKTEKVPEEFYKNSMPKPAQTTTQRIATGIKSKFYTVFKSSKKQPPIQSFIQTAYHDREFYELILFYGDTKYYALFKTEK